MSAALGLASADLIAQEPSERFKLKVNVDLVVIEATVKDRSGRVIDDLKPEDFLIYDEKVQQTITHFSQDELPLAVALVVDASGSIMPFLTQLKAAALRALRSLKSDDEVALFVFNNYVYLLEPFTRSRERIADRIMRIRVGGGTNINDAVYEAARYLKGTTRDKRRVIVLVSDNEGTVMKNHTEEDALREVLEAGASLYSIKVKGTGTGFNLFSVTNSGAYVLGIPVYRPKFGNVKRFAQETGGEVIDFKDAGSLEKAFELVISRLKTRYTLGYVPSSPVRDGRFRRVEVKLNKSSSRVRDSYAIQARRGYYALP